ncbi:MAG: translation initiation factor IF-2 [Nostocaceae cyanobacterium]|nr:translation initiation factor IF-2 [Nostocaceae cyanobacterium]
MNNSKVRIYELSKELNLDNKELLAICDQLNIAVKSHSSTITESEAECIRIEAEKLAATHVAPKKEAGGTHHKQHSPQGGNRPRPSALPNKQQILEIRKPTKPLRGSHSSSPDMASTSTTSQPPNSINTPLAPKPFAAPASPMKPTAPTRPSPRNQSDATPTQPAATDANNPVRTKQTQEKGSNPPKKPEKPQLAAPPARPAATAVDKETHNEGTENSERPDRPILKRDQHPGKQQGHKPAKEATGDGSEKPARRQQQVGREERKSGRPQQQPVTELQRPKPLRPEPSAPPAIANRPKPAAAKVSPDLPEDEATDTEELIEPVETLLKRPSLPRPVKGGKKWQEEEIDETKEAAKVGKAGKNKRVKPIVDDLEEEDFILDDEDDLDNLTPVQVSLSVARPPKPKAAARPPQQTSANASGSPVVSRGKKGSGSRDQQRRREPTEQKRDRPEILVITGSMTVQELADALVVADTEIVKILFMKGMAVNITQSLDIPTITLVASELEVEVETAEKEAEARKETEWLDERDLENLQRRPPVVTIMGHVDHGKTTLLDSIRKTKVAAGEAGGITQHIGAYHVDVEHEGQMQQVVFLDTPGHEAFTAMRARGARVTDIAILVVAADDGVRPQTIEAISHAQAAGVPIVVAINKIDKEGAQPDRVKQELTQYALTPEEWGGDTIMVPVSAIKGENLDTLLEMILLVSEVEDLHANPDRAAKGTVIEAHLDKAKGAVATLLIQNGTLHVGDILVAGSAFGKVRAMMDDRGTRVDTASPSFAVEVLGLSEVPAAGDEFEVFQNEKEARALASERAEKQRETRLKGGVTLTTLSAQAQEGELKELNLILKADVQGSVEAIIGTLKQIPQNEVQIRLLLAAPGEITETDIDLASASKAVIIGFNTTFASGARQAADEAAVDVREYNIIYKLLEDIEGALEGLLEPELVEEPLGQAEVRAVFPVGRGAVAGCYVQSGKLLRNCKLRVRRGGKVIYEGVLDSLKRIREDAREVNSGFECGVGVDKFNEWVMGDIIEAYQMVTKRRTLASANR